MRAPFGQRALDMGLVYDAGKLMASYRDTHSEVVYRQLVTMMGGTAHPTDAQIAPIQAIYTKPVDIAQGDEASYQYCGTVSDIYQFVGNDVLIGSIRDAIQEVGFPIVREHFFQSEKLTMMRNEIIVESSQAVPQVGDVLPVLIIENSYDGTKAATVSFGITTNYNSQTCIFAFELGTMRQVHLVNSATQMASAISSYMQVFAENITDMITRSFTTPITEEQMLGSLDLIERVGKKRREEVSKLLTELNPPAVEGEPPPPPSAWQMFLAIIRYSSFEENLNAKRLMENAAESVLVIPTRMYDVLQRLQA